MALEMEVLAVFEPQKNIETDNAIKEWRNSSRHYGPDSMVTVDLLEKIIDSLGEEVPDKIQEVFKYLQLMPSSRTDLDI